MNNYYLAIDIGASSGRHILGYIKDGKIILEEIYRFENTMEMKNHELCWNLDKLFYEIKAGMKKCKDIGKVPRSASIDTWAVDFVLLDENDNILGNTAAYRDSRTKGMDEKVYSIISEESLYERTGIQKQIFNTIYQLMAVKEKHPKYIKKAKSMLMIPDYFHYLLSGVKKTEYTNATTTQLVSPETKDWDRELIEQLGFPQEIFLDIVTPGTVLGGLTKEIQKEIGYDCQIVMPATHDTGSAIIAVPSNKEDTLYISSGTWSLMGIERAKADCSLKSMVLNFTNEGGYDYRFRYLKNIMGLWMIQCARKEFSTMHSFAELCDMASKESISTIVDCNNSGFLAPESMLNEIKKYCRETKQQEPVTDGEFAAVIYNSLALCYGNTIKEIEELTGLSYDQIYVVGGGANAEYLNQLTAKYTGRKVAAGPVEATAVGNLAIQMMMNDDLTDLQEARNCIYKSFEIKIYK
ncbi:rhamnulokinase [Clostridium swellfunianum]|uniref:rhamnulokinase n=1 Tax=Clostridium swellfunianum TaxID=1367462 RepID=UPI0020309B06|nr:rhamnulokinase [Clostridium swellfunianum]MCM0647610.1 rhamnulokinase [Clostridium swellfunianum]